MHLGRKSGAQIVTLLLIKQAQQEQDFQDYGQFHFGAPRRGNPASPTLTEHPQIILTNTILSLVTSALDPFPSHVQC